MFIAQLVILQVMIFVGLVVVLRGLMGQHATKATAHLQGLSQDYLRKQEELKKRLEEAERFYQEQLAKAQEEARQLKANALQEAEAARRQLVEQARQEAERIVQRALATQTALKEEMMQGFEAKVMERACELIQQALPRQLRQDIHAAWVNELMTNGLSHLNRLAIPSDAREAHICSAFPLSAEQREMLRQRLQTTCGDDVILKETTDSKVVAGLTITFGSLVLDGSLVSKIQEAARHAQESP